VEDVKFGRDVVQLGDDLERMRGVGVELVGHQNLVDRRRFRAVIVHLVRPEQVLLEHGQSRRVADVVRLDLLTKTNNVLSINFNRKEPSVPAHSKPTRIGAKWNLQFFKQLQFISYQF